MISSSNYKSVEIDIITYKKIYNKKVMNEEKIERHCKNNHNKFICSICLNKPSREDNRNLECCKRKSKYCPICDKSNEMSKEGVVNKDKNEYNHNYMQKTENNGKNIQTSQPDVTQGLSLLNEVLTVFQNKKQSASKNKTTILKDACVATDFKNSIPKLSFSKVIHYSIEEKPALDSQFVVVNSQPEVSKASQFSMDLTKHKSSSIPQMKLEELKNALKEKTKSKDAIEEVNRMFATVRKCGVKENSERNRPMIRSGPRILPVVKTDLNNQPLKSCRCCQTNYRMSSGDTYEGCQRKLDSSDQGFHTMCCQHQIKKSSPICSHCKRCEHTE